LLQLKEVDMSSVIVIEFVSLDGIMQDPDGAEGFERGGWAFRYGPAAVAGDKFKLGEVLETGALLLGRATWQRFAQIWPTQTDDFSQKMNRIPKLVASHTLERVDEWSNSSLLRGDLVDEVARRKRSQDLIIAGSASLVHTLMEHDLIDEYRLLVFPIVLGAGSRLFRDQNAPIELQLIAAEPVGAAVLLQYHRAP
jgi:dihydrofolate reductase